jgi:hypothetical protein
LLKNSFSRSAHRRAVEIGVGLPALRILLPIALAEIGLTDLTKEDVRKIAVRATADGETIHNEPFEVEPDLVADAIMAADAMGRAWRKDHDAQRRSYT